MTVGVETTLDQVGLALAGGGGPARRSTATGLLGVPQETRRWLWSLSRTWPPEEPLVVLHWTLFDWPLPSSLVRGAGGERRPRRPVRPAPSRAVRPTRPAPGRRGPAGNRDRGILRFVHAFFARLLNVR